jgi:RHS repeat-associated protein
MRHFNIKNHNSTSGVRKGLSMQNKCLIKVIILFAALVSLLSIQSLSWSSNDSVIIYHYNDITNSPVLAEYADGRVVWQEKYEPFGEPKGVANNYDNHPVNYTGHQFDADTNLHAMGARYYDPRIGRFMGVDPVGFVESNPMSFNRYLYANNNPYRFYDPDGRYAQTIACTTTVIGAAICGAGVAIGYLLIKDPAEKLAETVLYNDNHDTGEHSGDGEDTSKSEEGRKKNPTKSESPVWKGLKPHRGKTKTNGKKGKNKKFYEWDHTHDDIEVYGRGGQHEGTIDPTSGEKIKPKVEGREIDL